MKDRIKKADEKLTVQAQKALDVVYFGACIVLSKSYGWGKKRIKRLVDVAAEIFTECGTDQHVSLVQMCDEETGIEFRGPDGQSWRDTVYLNEEKWQKEQKRVFSMPMHMQKAYMLRVKGCMNKWLRPILMSSVALALHRKEGWGFERIQRFVILLEDCIRENNSNQKLMLDKVFEQTGLRYSYTNKNELVLLNAREIEGMQDE